LKNLGEETFIYHITDMSNLPKVIAAGGLLSDALLAQNNAEHTIIGYANIKQRRLNQIAVKPSVRFVGEFVPFYYCPRSPMLLTINSGNTGRPEGCQKTILHLVSRVKHGVELGRDWAISDINAGIPYVGFYRDIDDLNKLNWEAIRANYWKEVVDEKMAEFLVEDNFPWGSIIGIACFDEDVKAKVEGILEGCEHRPMVIVKRAWYY